MSEALKKFALKGREPRNGQRIVIDAIEKAFKTKDTVVLEAPVGSGKSAIAMTIAEWLGNSHILTPRKSLQDQYYNDFPEITCVMKGKSGYPCVPRMKRMPAAKSAVSNGVTTYFPSLPQVDETSKDYIALSDSLKRRIPVFFKPEVGCDEGPCANDTRVKKNCTMNDERPCPYNVAMNVAQISPHVVHNVHSFFYQNKYGEGFAERELLVVDEAHDLEGIVRGFLQTRIMVMNQNLDKAGPLPQRSDPVQVWAEWFLKSADLSFDKLQRLYPDIEFDEQIKAYYSEKGRWVREEVTPSGSSKVVSTPEKKFAESISKILDIYGEMESSEYVVSTVDNQDKQRKEFTFTPLSLKGRPESMFLSYGKKRLLMSGTIYDRSNFCRNLGLNPASVEFIVINSEFPVRNRPIFAYSDLMTNNSHKAWEDTDAFPKMIANIKKILSVYKDKKGLIHAPSYSAAQAISAALQDDRIITHSSSDFLDKLDYFCGKTDGNEVLISPTCQQGVDFKGGIARFQLVLRVPYLNTTDDFIDHMRETNFPWYNYQSLIIFGQQIGRVVRSVDDWGHTYLLDSRFLPYLKRNRSTLQNWLNQAIQYR